MLSFTEENYLKSIFLISTDENAVSEVGTNNLASFLNLKPATVNDMLKKLKDKKMIHYEKYGKITLSAIGKKYAIEVLRKQRLWETFLYEKLDFTWDEVQEVSEQLEHIKSHKLINKLDEFLNFPEFDPHGEVIPNAKGEMRTLFKKRLSEVEIGHYCKMIAVKDTSAPFLQYVVKLGLGISSSIKVIDKNNYDHLIEIEVNGKRSSVSQKFAENIFIVCNNCEIGHTCLKKHCEIQ
ncbi:MAG TPA: metal-dependent transcriptional regulator [Saprospiraceae bacterium]|nr:metal-dependent transcriptional regulator [Saprospiraceae bacterium]